MLSHPNFQPNIELGSEFTLFAFNSNQHENFEDAQFKGAFALASVSTITDVFTALNAAVRTDAMLNGGQLKFALVDSEQSFDIGRFEVQELEKFESDPNSFVDFVTNIF